MIGLGTLVNVGAVIAGGAVGTLARKGLPEKFKNIILQAIGISFLMIGISGALQGMFRAADDGRLDRSFIMLMIFSMAVGGIVGETIEVEKKLESMSKWLQKRFAKEGGSFSEGFVTASLMFCVGGMAIVGSLEDGLMSNPNTLFAKAILDGVISVVFVSTFGIGAAFSALPILVYQGGITLLAFWLKPWLTEEVITQMSLVGSVLISCLGINLLEIRKIKVGSLLPAMFVPLALYVVKILISGF